MSTGGTGALTTFHPFQRLPAELRLKIWEESLKAHSSRVVEINFSFETMKWHPCAPPPAQLHASHEARQVALKRYHPATLQRDGSRPAMVFLDFSHDTIFLRSPSNPAAEHIRRVYDQVLLDLASIRANCLHVALPAHLVTGMPLVRLLAHFHHLEALTIVAPTPDIQKPSGRDEEQLSLIPDRRPRKKMSRTLAAAAIIRFSTVVGVVRHAQAVRRQVDDALPGVAEGKERPT